LIKIFFQAIHSARRLFHFSFQLPRNLDIRDLLLVRQSSLDLLLAAFDCHGTFRVLRRLRRGLGIRTFRQGLGLLLALLGLLEQVFGVLDLLLGGVLREASVTTGVP